MRRWSLKRGLSPMFALSLSRIDAPIEVKLEKLIMRAVKRSVETLSATLNWSPTIRAH